MMRWEVELGKSPKALWPTRLKFAEANDKYNKAVSSKVEEEHQDLYLSSDLSTTLLYSMCLPTLTRMHLYTDMHAHKTYTHIIGYVVLDV